MSRLTDEQLMEQVKVGNVEAYDALFRAHGLRLLRILHSILSDRELAVDVVQDGWITVWQKAETFDQTKGTFLVWITQILKRRAYRVLRQGRGGANLSAHTLLDVEQQKTFPGPEEAFSQSEIIHKVNAVLQSLNEKDMRLLKRYYFEGISAKRVGEPYGMTESSSTKALFRARNKFRCKYRQMFEQSSNTIDFGIYNV